MASLMLQNSFSVARRSNVRFLRHLPSKSSDLKPLLTTWADCRLALCVNEISEVRRRGLLQPQDMNPRLQSSKNTRTIRAIGQGHDFAA